MISGTQAGFDRIRARKIGTVNTYSIVANTTPEAAYAYVADITTHSEWSPDNIKVEPEQAGPPSVGAKYKMVGDLVGKPNSSVVVITALTPGRSVTFMATDSNSEIQHEFTFTKDPNGTRVDRNVTGIKGPLIFKIIFPILEPLVIRPGTMKCMGMLKDRLEARKS
jgi:hypothetical protein